MSKRGELREPRRGARNRKKLLILELCVCCVCTPKSIANASRTFQPCFSLTGTRKKFDATLIKNLCLINPFRKGNKKSSASAQTCKPDLHLSAHPCTPTNTSRRLRTDREALLQANKDIFETQTATCLAPTAFSFLHSKIKRFLQGAQINPRKWRPTGTATLLLHIALRSGQKTYAG